MTETYGMSAQRSLAYRFWRALGFGVAPKNLDVIDWRCNEDPTYAPGALVTDTYISVDWVDRLRIVVSGKMRLEVSTKTDVLVNRSISQSIFRVLPPHYPFRAHPEA